VYRTFNLKRSTLIDTLRRVGPAASVIGQLAN
jgi:hypothetical protein